MVVFSCSWLALALGFGGEDIVLMWNLSVGKSFSQWIEGTWINMSTLDVTFTALSELSSGCEEMWRKHRGNKQKKNLHKRHLGLSFKWKCPYHLWVCVRIKYQTNKRKKMFFVCSSKLLTPHFVLISLYLAPVYSLSWVLPSIWYFPEPCVRFWDSLFFPSIFTYFYSTASFAKSTPVFCGVCNIWSSPANKALVHT